MISRRVTGRPVTHRRVPARVGLVGNPSDGFGGAVLAAVVDAWAAEVRVTPRREGFGIRSGHVGAVELASPAEVLDRAAARDPAAPHAIVAASLAALRAHLGHDLPALDVEWSSTIPRSVGLAGSSAIAVAVIDAVAAGTGRRLDARVTAALALEAETVGLGIAAGWQDRIVQAHRTAVLVDRERMSVVDGVAVPGVHAVTGLRVEAVVGWRPNDAEDSGSYHAELRRRADRPDVDVGMRELAALARRATRCAARGDVAGLAELVDASWLARRGCAPIRPAHAELVEAARSAGVAATSPGSGGSVVALPTGQASAEATVAALEIVGADVAVVRLR